jgi:hypothetical protein
MGRLRQGLRLILFAVTIARMSWRQSAVAGLRALHYAILGWGVLGWAIPHQGMLIMYLVAMPAIALQWQLNRNTCVLNNIESWLATGRWRDETDSGQGGFIAGLFERATGWRPSPRMTDLIAYGLLGAFWILAAAHLTLRY